MRKILISILLVLLIVLAFFTIFQGISIGSFQVLSTEQIIALNDNLTLKIEEANRKIKSDLQNKKSELFDNVELLNESKESYYRVANVSTESEIAEASTEEIYNWEYLYLRVGRHARQDGVNINMTAVSAGSADANLQNIHFIVEGPYAGIIEFISSLEEDSELAFRIENFNLLPDGDNLQATFDVNGIRIKIENTTENVSNQTQNTNTTDTATDTNTITDTNTVATDATNTAG